MFNLKLEKISSFYEHELYPQSVLSIFAHTKKERKESSEGISLTGDTIIFFERI